MRRRRAAQFVVATVNSLEGYPIEDYAYRLGRAWKIGSAKEDNGVLLLVAPKEHKVWIATGYGAGGFLTDAMAGVITREAILPKFKAGDMGGGIEAGADAIIKQMSLPPEEAQKNIAAARTGAEAAPAFRRQPAAGDLLVDGLRFHCVVALPARCRAALPNTQRRHQSVGHALGSQCAVEFRTRRRLGRRLVACGGGGWGGGGGGGFGGFSGGGGSFGGGGAGGSW